MTPETFATPCFPNWACYSDDPGTRAALDPTCVPGVALSPCAGSRLGGTPFTVAGLGYKPGAQVSVGGNPATVLDVKPTEIHATAPASATFGVATVLVQNPGEPARTLGDAWVYLSDSPPGILTIYKDGTGWPTLTWPGAGPNLVEWSATRDFECRNGNIMVASPPLGYRPSPPVVYYRVR